ncbi:MAG TPA: metal-dependent hydrolase [Gallionella sp.]|nr:metal-dependent hydrolase [Gallionella sp.]
MRHLNHPASTEDLSGNWCNNSAVTSSLMEAISFSTPVLEKFFVRTVAEGLPGRDFAELDKRCIAFIREESVHSNVHRKFNAALLAYLGQVPPGVALVESLLQFATNKLSLPSRLLLASALEHFAAVISKGYVEQEAQMQFSSTVARKLFAQHAHEELAHRSVVFDLWLHKGATGSVMRALTLLAILFAGFVYVSIAVPWILHRKCGQRLRTTLAALVKHARNKRTHTCIPLAVLFSFAGRDYHPDRLLDETVTT